MTRPRAVLAYKYKAGTMRIANEFLPQLPHLSDGYVVRSAEIVEAGAYKDGTEYQLLRVITGPGTTEPDR